MGGFKRHVWLFNGKCEIKALGACQPTESSPVIICLSWKQIGSYGTANTPATYLASTAEFNAFKRVVMNEVRDLFKGVCDVVFIGRHRQNPGHMCRYLNDDGSAIF